MVTKKFGLAELERYQREVGFKNGDVRTIKGVLAIVNIPNAVVSEAEEAISVARDKVAELIRKRVAVKADDVEDEQITQESIADLRAERLARKADRKVELADVSVEDKKQNDEIAKLATILKKFS